ncbi:hypothetical protein TSOC_000328 [Tetrabaena socialis]|uniref:Uncharacterized protein n=1 Tax=Tetrabaena socialis TaxID=47790 RepID=A0A2J8AJK4_9CHLO|nr:hypothetical protein TSOC_000328 [Tetrabaena socialis]|eukprot:PNH12689.1 hypothetical protein TSOC_000328 [Tetrabaena socialis]
MAAALRGDGGIDALLAYAAAAGGELLPLSAFAHEGLTFTLDDLIGSYYGAPVHAFKRAVCLPHAALGSLPATREGLERKVRQLLMELMLRVGGPPADAQAMAAHLRPHDLRVAITHPARPQVQSHLTRCISAPFLVVSSDDGNEVVVVDAALREHLAVAPSTPAYERSLAVNVPEVFVGSRARLMELVRSMGTAIALNFASQGLHVPPWRRTGALLNRWPAALAEAQEQVAACSGGQQGAAVQDSGRAEPTSLAATLQPAGTATRLQLQQPHGGQQPQQLQHRHAATLVEAQACAAQLGADACGLEGQVHGALHVRAHVGGAGLAARQGRPLPAPAIVVVGFEVGDCLAVAVKPREAAPIARRGRLADLCGSQASNKDSSCADSEGMGASPSPHSVFREG